MRTAVLTFVFVLTSSCASSRLPLRRICPDGWPLKILQDPNCHRGICGYTCAPDRWRTT